MKLSSRGEREKEKMRAGAKKLKKKEETAFLSKEIDVSYSATILVQGRVWQGVYSGNIIILPEYLTGPQITSPITSILQVMWPRNLVTEFLSWEGVLLIAIFPTPCTAMSASKNLKWVGKKVGSKRGVILFVHYQDTLKKREKRSNLSTRF